MEPCASTEPSTLLWDESPRDIQCNLRSNELGPSHPRAVVDSHELIDGVLVAQDDADEAANKAADAEVDAEALYSVLHRWRLPRMRFDCQTSMCLND